MDELYEKFLSRENFELAYSRIKHWPKNAYKFFYKTDIEAFEVFLSNNIEQLISEIQELKYRPERGCVYYIPKKKLFIKTDNSSKLFRSSCLSSNY